jgi:GT2 family glycosyltransferase
MTHEVIVVDNASGDGTRDWISRCSPETRLFVNSTNLGFAKGCNLGIRESHGDYVLLLNPDTRVAAGTFLSTWEYMQSSPRLAACGCKILRPDGSMDLSCKRNFPSPWDALCRMLGLSKFFPQSTLFARYDARQLDENRRQEVPLIDGCYMMIRREALDDIGLFDERFFMYAEEMDWCRRAHLRGWSIGYDPSGTIVHIKGEITKRSPFRMLYHFHRSMALYCSKHYKPWNPVLLAVYPAIALRLAILVVVNFLKTDRRVSK